MIGVTRKFPKFESASHANVTVRSHAAQTRD